MSTYAVLLGMGALDGKELFAIEGPEKLALNCGTTRRSAKEGQKAKKKTIKPPGRHKHRHTARRNNVQISSANRAWTSEEPSRRKYEILPKARGLTHERSTTAHRNNVQIFKCELGLRIGVHIHVENVEMLLKAEHLSLHIYGHVSNFPEHQELHLWNLDETLLHNRNVHHSEDELNLGQEDSNLWTVGTCRC